MRGPPPSPAVAFGQFLACQLFLEASFYWSHRLLHVPALYKRFHKQVTHATLFAHWNHNSHNENTYGRYPPPLMPVFTSGVALGIPFHSWMCGCFAYNKNLSL